MDEETKKELRDLRKKIKKLERKVNRSCGNCAAVSRFSCGWTIYECGSGNNYRNFITKKIKE